MTRPETPGDDVVDRLVAEYLQRRARQMDAGSLIARIRMSRQVDRAIADAAPHAHSPSLTATVTGRGSVETRPTRGRLSRAISLSALAAVALLAAFLGGRQLGPRAANAAVVLRDMRVVHQTGIDRCYSVQYTPDPRYWDGKNELEGPSHSVLWIRGDQFWSDCSIGDLRLVIGRADDQTLWIRRSSDEGIVFVNAASQLPPEVSLLCAVNAMTVPRLVDDVLADFDLRVDGPSLRGESERTVIWASLRPGHSHPLISSALLEVDPHSGSLMRLVLWMKRDGHPRGTVTYTFLRRGVQEDDQYQLAGHLDADAHIEIHSFKKEEVE